MARITCSRSGVLFSCEHMPLALHSREYHHPLFNVSKKKLISLSGEWANNRLTPTESYLLYLSLLNSTDHIEWRSPARYVEHKTMQYISNNMESLVKIIGKIDLIQHPSFTLPKFIISHDTGDLSTSFYWIQAWNHNYNEFMEGYKASLAREELKTKLDRREFSLERLIKSAHTSTESLANNLSYWASLSGDFPDGDTPHPFTNLRISISDYWQEIIKACAKDDKIWKYPQSDIEELITHCEDNIPHGNIFAAKLMKLLRDGLKKKDDYLGFGDVDLAGKTTTFRILNPLESKEDAQISGIIMSASDTEPKRSNYPTNFAYIKAKMNWDLKNSYKKSGNGE